ncbi:molybdopterin converting factor subunit 1 [Rhodopila sp.]|uniref:molybdopterin converting factor subunit 1 n=1 Tax=Rhodopila sp. TaxID=2480087 RepID=UPI003D0E259D
MTQPLKIWYFAWLREQIGLAQEEFALPVGVSTVGALMDCLSTRDPTYARAFQKGKTIRCAINQEFADRASPIQAGDEVAFFPAVTGG